MAGTRRSKTSLYEEDVKGVATFVEYNRGIAVVRVLVVEDFEPFRQFICSKLKENPHLQVVCEVADGLEALRKAEELQPDLLLMDVGLPTLNGIEAARQIRNSSPNSKIVFVSQESSADVVAEAFRLGALGYVAKTDAGNDLLPAVSAALRGERFASRRFAANSIRWDEPCTPSPLPTQAITACHKVIFYADDQHLFDEMTQFVASALQTGNAVLVVATESHRDGLLPRLQANGLDMDAAIRQGRYVAFDASEALSTCMVNGISDPAQFVEILGSLIATAAAAATGEQPRVAFFGEGVNLLWMQGDVEAAIQIEKLCNDLTRTHDVDILCGYCLGCVDGGMDRGTFQRICAEHSVVHSG